MKKNNIVVVFSSHLSDEENQKFIAHIKATIGVKHKTVCYPNFNQFSLSELYNKAIKEYSSPESIFVMCHNDIIIKTQNWGRVLLRDFNQTDYAILGVAGTTFVPDTGRWWEDISKMYGVVEHTNGHKNWISEYSSEFYGIQSVVHVDGLFMAIDHTRIEKKFNEEYGKFHFYDITFCLDNYLEGCNIGVITSIKILHKSVGVTDSSWETNRIKFAKEYDLPLRHVTEQGLNVLICCQFFHNYTGSEVSNFELARALVKKNCNVTILSSVVGNPMLDKARKCGIKVFSMRQPPNYVINKENKYQFIKNEAEFDIIHVNHKPIGEMVMNLYPNTPAVMHVRSEVIPTYEEPIIHPMIKRYISIRDSITDYIKTFGVEEDKITLIDNPFDSERFNTDYELMKNFPGRVLFVGTLDHLRKNILFDLREMTREKNLDLWIIGANNGGYVDEIIKDSPHVTYYGVQSKVEDYIKKCNYTAGIFKGRTTIEGFLCGKSGWIYTVDNQGNIISKELQDVPEDLEKYSAEYSAERVLELYENIIEETWLV